MKIQETDGKKMTAGGNNAVMTKVRSIVRHVRRHFPIYIVESVNPFMNILFVVFSYLARHGTTKGNENMTGRSRRRLKGK